MANALLSHPTDTQGRASTAGALLSVSGGAVVDLIRASAPLLSLTQRAALTTDRALVEVSSGAAVKLGQLTALTASSLTIKGHALSVTGGATMSVAGDLFRIANGSTLTLTNGALLSLSGGSTLNITGALINFIGTGNTLSITNGLSGNGGCSMIGNLPFSWRAAGTITSGTTRSEPGGQHAADRAGLRGDQRHRRLAGQAGAVGRDLSTARRG